jgi:ribosomal protein S18 acetylase RimI-like enzyme
MNIEMLHPDQWLIYKNLYACMSDEERSSSFHDTYDILLDDQKWYRRIADIGNPLLFAKQDDQYVGMIGARSMSPIMMRIVSLYVLPAYRRKGIASELLSTILDHIRQFGIIKAQLLVDTKAEPALSLYRKHAFEIITKIGFLSENQWYNQYLMERQIN